MTDIKEKINEKTMAEACPVAAPAPKKPQGMSPGEAWFEDFFYNKINYWLNLGMSLLATDFFTHEGDGFFTHHGTGKRWLESGSQKLAKGLEAIGLVKAEKAISSTRAGLRTLALNTGGWLLLLPLFIAERHKRAIVHWKNKRLGVDQRAPDGHEMTPDEIYLDKEQPKQSFLWVAGRRTLASASTIVTGVLLDKVATTTVSNPVTGEMETITGQNRITDLIRDMVNNTVRLTHIPGSESFVNNGFIQRYLGFAALDTFYTWMTATVMHKTNGAKHLKNGEAKARAFRETGKEINLPAAAPVAAPSAPARNAPTTARDTQTLQEKYKTNKNILVSKSHADAVKDAEPHYTMAP